MGRNRGTEKRERPIGISILSVLHMIGGAGIGILIVPFALAMRSNPEMQQATDKMGFDAAFIVISVGFLCFLGLGSGIGMWRGAWWGWYLGSFYYIYAICRNLNVLLMIPVLMSELSAEEIESSARGPGHYYIKHGVRIVISALIYLYFFKRNVRAYFLLDTQSKWKAALAEVGICIALVIVGSAVAQGLG